MISTVQPRFRNSSRCGRISVISLAASRRNKSAEYQPDTSARP